MARPVTASAPEPVRLGDAEVAPGTRRYLDLPVARLVSGAWVSLPVAVLHGRRRGPGLWLSAAIHGDELNGMEIIRRVLRHLDPRSLVGSVIAVPVVNVFGFIEQNRYLPDRRDLNRSFPGAASGSLASRLAHLFITEVVDRCEYAIDFHTGSQHRENLPQIRTNLADPENRRLAAAFGAPLTYQAPYIKGSLRSAADARGVHLLLYEGGEPLRFDPGVIRTGVEGTLRVLDALGMWPAKESAAPPPTFEAGRTRWVRAVRSGIFRHTLTLGTRVEKGQVLGKIYSDFFTVRSRSVRASAAGLVMGFTNNPLVNQGDALVHLAEPVEVPAGAR